MSDTYQAIFDAVRSALRNTDVASAIRDACHLDASFAIEQVKQEFVNAAAEMARPSVLYRPTLNNYDDEWHAEYPASETGLAHFSGSGKTPADAMTDFDNKWYGK